MIIFRSSLLFLVLTVTGCGQTADEVRPLNEEIVRITVKRDGQYLDRLKFLEDYRSNPNRFDDQDFIGPFEVSGMLREVPLYDPTEIGESGPIDPIYMLTLHASYNARLRSDQELRPVSVFMREFSRQKAAELEPGMRLKVDCAQFRIVNSKFVFDECEVVSSKH